MGEIAFPGGGPGLTERLTGGWLAYGEIKVSLKAGGLTSLENAFIESIYPEPGHAGETAEERAMRAAPMVLARENWTIRLGIDAVEGIDSVWEDIKIGGQTCRALSVETLDKLPRKLRAAALDKIRVYTGLSDDEKDEVVFTSPSPAT